jgi:hypothetical protein
VKNYIILFLTITSLYFAFEEYKEQDPLRDELSIAMLKSTIHDIEMNNFDIEIAHTDIDMAELTVNFYKNKLQRLLKSEGIIPETTIKDAEFALKEQELKLHLAKIRLNKLIHVNKLLQNFDNKDLDPIDHLVKRRKKPSGD